MKIDRRTFTKSIAVATGALALPSWMEFNQHDRPVPYLPDFLDFRNRKVWPNDRDGLGVTVDEKQLTFIEAMTEAASDPTYLHPVGSPSHW